VGIDGQHFHFSMAAGFPLILNKTAIL
jgi:hypothetical protein